MRKIYSFLLVAMFAMTAWAQSTRTIYLDASFWAADNPVYAIYVWNLGDEDAAGYYFEQVEGNIWKADIRDDATVAIFLRKNPEDPDVRENIWAGWWNRSTTSIPADKNLHKITSWSDGEDGIDHGTWSVYGEEEPEQPSEKVIVKVRKPEAWTQIFAYEWANGKSDVNDLLGGWPGTELQDLGNGWFGAYVYPEANLILNNNASEQANDYWVTENVCLEGVGNRIDVTIAADCAGVPDPEGGDPVVEPAKDVVIKVHKLDTWGSMSIWAWGSSDPDFMAQFVEWPGVAMQALEDGWFKFTIKSDAWFIVNNGEGTEQSQAAQAPENACFSVSTEKNSDGHYAIENADCPEGEGVEEIGAEKSANRKMIKDGQLIILRDGKTFNVLGSEL